MDIQKYLKNLMLRLGKSYKETEQRMAEEMVNNWSVIVRHSINDSDSLEREIVDIDQ